MTLRNLIKGALSKRKAAAEDAEPKPDLATYKLDKNQCYAILMTQIHSTGKLTSQDWFDPTIAALVEMDFVQAFEWNGETDWRLTGLGENIAEYLTKSGVSLTLSR
ncbi:MAG: hypothetical protein HOO19_04865 [Rhodospirillaceae bacterium]|jgi:hypothetical protein|nr:hypothetical protein [Rhodospirillaceae bacterium]MBT3884781.1 hypothetical protein [Rhodospirillaceae bacterium]MBT4115821.1 hypothetical protein [Rhodospirillaceae bacterium]MBT4673217.1 hypothetical protein [Rhodospirillaceae bacterium]MBT4748637.1 hypothetical protein [Rhodospirillaceae bacterium]